MGFISGDSVISHIEEVRKLLLGLLRSLKKKPITHHSSLITHHHTIMSIEAIWIATGFFGQGLFFMRWVVQWLASERSAESKMPVAFWYMSLIGGLITLAYAIYRKDPVFIAGQSIGAVVYVRNLMLLRRTNNAVTGDK